MAARERGGPASRGWLLILVAILPAPILYAGVWLGRWPWLVIDDRGALVLVVVAALALDTLALLALQALVYRFWKPAWLAPRRGGAALLAAAISLGPLLAYASPRLRAHPPNEISRAENAVITADVVGVLAALVVMDEVSARPTMAVAALALQPTFIDAVALGPDDAVYLTTHSGPRRALLRTLPDSAEIDAGFWGIGELPHDGDGDDLVLQVLGDGSLRLVRKDDEHHALRVYRIARDGRQTVTVPDPVFGEGVHEVRGAPGNELIVTRLFADPEILPDALGWLDADLNRVGAVSRAALAAREPALATGSMSVHVRAVDRGLALLEVEVEGPNKLRALAEIDRAGHVRGVARIDEAPMLTAGGRLADGRWLVGCTSDVACKPRAFGAWLWDGKGSPREVQLDPTSANADGFLPDGDGVVFAGVAGVHRLDATLALDPAFERARVADGSAALHAVAGAFRENPLRARDGGWLFLAAPEGNVRRQRWPVVDGRARAPVVRIRP